MSELFIKNDPNVYQKYLIHENGKPVLYAYLQKALYGTVHTTKLFWETLVENNKNYFDFNPYDEYISNKNINRNQCAIIIWNLDDLMISYMESTVVDKIPNELNKEFGK